MEIAPHEVNVLASFVTYPLLTVEEVCKLHYQAGSVSYVNKMLLGMVKKKLLVRPQRPHVSKPYFYHLGRRGVKFLTNNGITATFTAYAYPAQVDHLQTTTALMMAMSRLPLSSPEFTIKDMEHDLVLKNTRLGMRPDVLSDIGKGTTHARLWWEVEMQKDQKQFREKKIRKLLEFLAFGYPSVYGEHVPTILLLTPVSQHKAEMMKGWLEAELESSGEVDKAYVFRVAYLAKEAFDAETLFFKRIWKIPFQEGYVRLFESQGSHY